MTQTLKKQLTVLCVASLCGGVLVWSNGALRAQDYIDTFKAEAYGQPHQKLTKNEAAKRFGHLMSAKLKLSTSNHTFDRTPDCISPRSERDLGPYRLYSFFQVMSNKWRQTNQTALPLVLVKENGGWGVDLIETYAKWNGLKGVDKAKAIHRLTGVILAELPRTEAVTRSTCQSNLRQIALGIRQYVQDYDEKFPSSEKWIDVLQPYVKSEVVFNCPALPRVQKYGYAFNFEFSDRLDDGSFDPAKIIWAYETSILKRNAYGSGENLAFRHQNGANYAFADGHVKWFPKTQIPSFKLKP